MNLLRSLLVAAGLLAVVLLSAACGSEVVTPTPVATVAPGPTLPPDQAGVLPARAVGRSYGETNMMPTLDRTPFPIPTPINIITYRLEFKNATGQDLMGFRGTLTYRDAQGREIESFAARFDTAVKQGQVVVADHVITDNMMMETRATLKTIPLSNVTVYFKPTFYVGTDGGVEPVTP
jgi:hypothetical protein